MRNIFIAILFISTSFSSIYSQITRGNVPSWVNDINYYNSEINKDDITEGTVLLLYDHQVNIEKQEVFLRLTTEITDNVGIQTASTINVAYDPTYQSLKFHKINIIRDGKEINKLNIADIQVIRREFNADNYLYDGSLSAIMHITDVRTGDIIDYSFSISGFNPIHNNKFSNTYYLNDIEPIGKISITILSKNKLQYKSFNTEIEPIISRENNAYKYSWVTTNTKKLDYEDNTPEWKILFESIFVSEYKSWKEVVDWGLEVYNVKEKPNSELLSKIEEINSTYKTQGDKIKATLDFVQNEIRYLGLEYGIGSYKPFTPNKVFNQRFGDCKDKSLLMTTMLNKMGIEAYPMLVNTSLKHNIKNILPSPKFFDHCVVKVIDGAKNELWYDPTMSNQGGSFKNTYFPDYEYGLVLKENNDDFDEIYSFADNKIETLEEYRLEEIGKGANLKITTVYYENEADNMRNYYKNNSINSITKEYEKFYSNYYYNITSLKSPDIIDDVKENSFTIYEEYKIDSIWRPMTEKENFISVTFVPSSITNTLYIPNKADRKSELAFYYPSTKQHRIKIYLPINWKIKEENIIVNSSGFYYEWDVSYNKKTKVLDVNHFLKIQKSYIEPNEYVQYIKDVNKVDQSLGYFLYIQEGNKSISVENFSLIKGIKTAFKFFLTIAFIAVIILLIFWQIRKKRKEKSI